MNANRGTSGVKVLALSLALAGGGFNAIAANVPSSQVAAVAADSVSHGLPLGLTLDVSTGVIAGTSTTVSTQANHVVNSGDASRVTLALSVQSTSKCAGPFSITHEPPVGCVPYPSSLWNKPLPADVMSHLAPNSDALVRAGFTNDGKSSYPWTRRNSAALSISNDGKDTGHPLYYGQASDPVYVIESCKHPSKGIHKAAGVRLHAPSGAAYSGLHGDQHLDIWDQTDNILFSSYGSGGRPPLPACPGNGHAGSMSDPCPVTIQQAFCSVSNWTTDPGYGFSGEDSLGNGGYALHPTVAEMKAGIIPHAIYLWQDCQVGSVFPQQGGVLECPSGMTRAPSGSLFFLDYTKEQLADIKSKVPSYQYALLEAMTIYGGYFGDTSTPGYPGPGGPWGFEGANAYLLAGLSYPLYDWLKSFPHDPTNSDPSQPLACYTYNSRSYCDLGMWVNVPLETGPNCRSTACDVSKHLHIADPSVAKELTVNRVGLYSDFKLDEGSGTVAQDSTANHNDGTVSAGVTWVNNPNGTGITFPADATFRQITTTFGAGLDPTTQSFSKCVVVLPDTQYAQKVIFSAGGNGTNQRWYAGWSSVGGQLQWGIGIQGSGFKSGSEFPVSNRLTRVCLRSNAETDTATLSVNGVVGTVIGKSVKSFTSYSLVGALQSGNDGTYTGNNGGYTIYEDMTWDMYLSDADLEEIFTDGFDYMP